jgi:hypothetical protein
MFRILIAAILALFIVTPVSAQSTVPEDVALAAVNACYAHETGADLVRALTAQGFRASARAEQRWVKNLPGFEFQVWLNDKAQSNGTTLRLCSVGVWGRLSNIGRVRTTLENRARSDGFTVPPPTPREKGGDSQMMIRQTGARFHALHLTANEAADSNKGANYVIIYGWTL